MATPNISALVVFTTTPLQGADWLTDMTQIVNWLADGNADLNVHTVTLGSFVNLKRYTTAQINALSGMVEGSLIMNSDTHRPMYFSGNAWENF